MAEKRARHWNCLFYPSSLPEDWERMLEELAIPCYVSPLHDKDKKPDGTLKTPHYHVTMCFPGKKSYDQVKEIVDKFNGARPEPTIDLGGTLRYMCHLDSENKHKYSPRDVKCFGGADYVEGISCVAYSKQTMRKIKLFIEDNDVRYFSDLSFYCSFYMPEWEQYVDHQAVYWKNYLTSRSDKKKTHTVNIFDDLIMEEIKDDNSGSR